MTISQASKIASESADRLVVKLFGKIDLSKPVPRKIWAAEFAEKISESD